MIRELFNSGLSLYIAFRYQSLSVIVIGSGSSNYFAISTIFQSFDSIPIFNLDYFTMSDN